MTYHREPGTFEYAIHDALRKVAPARLERATGLPMDSLYRASNPEHRQQLPATAAARIDAALVASGEGAALLPFLTRVYERALEDLGGAGKRAPGLPETAPMFALLTRYVGAHEAAWRDGKLDADDLPDLREGLKAIDEAHRLLARNRDHLERLITQLESTKREARR
jgi:hypothetical protein